MVYAWENRTDGAALASTYGKLLKELSSALLFESYEVTH